MEKLEQVQQERDFLTEIFNRVGFGVYVLDQGGNYLFANDEYTKMIRVPREVLLHYNTHRFLEKGQVDFCVFDIVSKHRQKVAIFQDIYGGAGGQSPVRYLVVATPVFNSAGALTRLIGIVNRLDQFEGDLDAARRASVSLLTISPDVSAHIGEQPIWESEAMKMVMEQALLVAGIDTTVLLYGESGTGKEVVMRYIHENGKRRDRPRVTVNCASLPENLLEAELFGYESGAFTGASHAGKKGMFEGAHKGTLCLDEINSLPLALQGKLLRAIETKTIQRVGATQSIKVDFQLIAATNESLVEMVEEKLFRADLFYRLNVIPITIPPLRERKRDIMPLASAFLSRYCEKYKNQKMFSTQVAIYMQQADWPGNVRELKNFVERAVVMSPGYVIHMADVQPGGVSLRGGEKAGAPGEMPTEHASTLAGAGKDGADSGSSRAQRMLVQGVSMKDYLALCEREYLSLACAMAKSTYHAAELLGTSQATVVRKRKRYKQCAGD